MLMMHFGGYVNIIISCIVVYSCIIIAIRLFGKKELAQLSVIDLVFILLISNAVQNAMVGSDSTLIGGLIAAATLFIINFIFKLIIYRFPKLGRMIEGEPLLLIYKGNLNHKNMKKAKITLDEIKETIREHGVLLIEDVDLAILEADGNVSVLTHDYQKRSSKKRKTRNTLKQQQ
jgi:uncharacterized membrane protein YcaP (DUF421 family)